MVVGRWCFGDAGIELLCKLLCTRLEVRWQRQVIVVELSYADDVCDALEGLMEFIYNISVLPMTQHAIVSVFSRAH